MLIVYCWFFLIFSPRNISLASAAASPIISCASSGTFKLPSNITTARLALSSPGILCTLTLNIGNDDAVIPVGRSYDSNHWEAAAGTYNTLDFRCDMLSCEVSLPETFNQGKEFRLNTFEHNLSRRDEIARFLEQSTCTFVRYV